MTQASIDQSLHLAVRHHQAGRFREAEKLYRQVLERQSTNADALHLLGVIERQAGRFELAIELMRRAIQSRPAYPEAHNNLGVALSQRKAFDEAIAAFRQAILLNPLLFDAYNNLGNALREKRDFNQALAALREALRLKPDSAKIHNNLGNVLRDIESLEDAIDSYRKAIRLNPNYAEAHNNLAVALRGKGLLDEALDACRQAIRLQPNFAGAFNTLAYIQRDKGLLDEAIATCQQALRIDPESADAHYTLGCALRDKGLPDEAISAFHAALRLRPDFAAAYDNLGNTLSDQGLLDEALACYDRASSSAPHDPVPLGNRVYTLAFHPGYGSAKILEEHLRWDALHGAPLRSSSRPHSNTPDPNRRLRIGYVSPDFRDHCQSLFTIPLLTSHDRGRFEIYCYSSVVLPDAVTDRFPPLVDKWRNVVGQSDAQLAEIIRSDAIDILVDLTMHMARGRSMLFARKPAPIQVAWLAYPGTTGLKTMDYRLTDPYLDPPGQNDGDYSEQSIRLPDTFWCYDPMTDEPAVNALPALEKGYVTFGCMNNFSKVNSEVLVLWAKVLNAVPNSRLLLLTPQGGARARTLEALAALNIDSTPVQFVAYQPRPKYLQTYHAVDIGLDTFPYNGHTTTLDSLWMGVPVVTVAGPTVVGRAGYSLLNNIGLPDLVAKTPEAFVEIATGLASNVSRLGQLRATLRERLRQSPLMDGPRFARNIEAAYSQMGSHWYSRP